MAEGLKFVVEDLDHIKTNEAGHSQEGAHFKSAISSKIHLINRSVLGIPTSYSDRARRESCKLHEHFCRLSQPEHQLSLAGPPTVRGRLNQPRRV